MATGRELKAYVSIAGKVEPSLAKAVSSATGSMSNLGNVAKSVSKAAAVAIGAIGTASVAAGKALVDLGTRFDDAYDTIRIGTGATGKDLEALTDSLKEVYKTVPTTLEDASSVIADYNTRLGITGSTLEGLSSQALQVADMLGDDVTSVVEESSQAFQQWNISSENMGAAMDYIFKVSQSTGVGFTELMSSMQGYGAQLQELGYSFEDAASLMGQLDKAGVNQTEVLAAMKKSVTAMAKEGKSASEGMKEYTEAIKNAGDATEATKIASEVFGTRAASTMSAAIRNGTLDVEGLTAALKESQETISGAAWDTYDFAEKWQLVKQNLETAIEPIASALFDGITAAMPYIQQALDDLQPKIEEWAKDLGPKIKDFAENDLPKLVEGVKGFAESLGSAISWIIDNWDILSKVVPVVAGIALAIGPLSSIVQGLSGVLPSLSSGLGSLSGKAASAASGISQAGASFKTMAGQALLLVAAGAAVLLIASAMSILADAAIRIQEADCIGTFIAIAAVGVGMALALAVIGSVATVSAIGLLALGAAVLLVGAGIGIAALGAAEFSAQLPTIAEYGLQASVAILAISGSMIVFSASLLATTISLLACTVAIGAFGAVALLGSLGAIAFAGSMGLAALASIGLLGGLLGVTACVEAIKNDAGQAAQSLMLMVTSVSVVQNVLSGLSSMAETAVNAFLSIFSSKASEAKANGLALGNGLAQGLSLATMSFNAAFMGIQTIAATQLAMLKAQFKNTKLELNRDIALPHFSLKGALDAASNTVPSVDVKWYAQGGFTNGLSIAGEEGTEAIISFNPAYRSNNLSYWAKAGQMLGVDNTIIDLMTGNTSTSTTSVNLGGVSFSPNITINGNANKEDVIAAIREEEPEFFDLLDRYIAMKGRESYGFSF